MPDRAIGSRSILLIEDDDRIRRMMHLALSLKGFDVAEAATGECGLEVFDERPFDAVCLDLMLPGQDGFAVCRDIRGGSEVPIIIVTARADSRDVVEGLEAGADDYISKPFAIQELVARIRALLRRATTPTSRASVRVGDLEIAPHEGLVLRQGAPVSLTRMELRLLCCLAASAGRVLTREELLEQVWGYSYFGDSRLVDVHVRRLRRKPQPFQARWDAARPGVALIHVTMSFASLSGRTQLIAAAQLVWTATEVPGFDRVLVELDGRPIALPTDTGLSSQPVRRSDFRSLAPVQ